MRPFTRTIIELFDGKKRYLIPLYQRQYAWKIVPQLELLWQDLERSVNKLKAGGQKITPHFLGAAVVSHVPIYGRQVQAYEVIDGQQRLTTFALLLSAFRDVVLQYDAGYADEAKKYLLNDGVMETPEVERYKVWPSLIDRAVFTRIVDDAGMGAPEEHVLEDEDHATKRLAEHAYEFFQRKIEAHITRSGAYDAFEMEKLWEAMKVGLAVVSIELEPGDDPQTIFETLNSRGLPLSQSDLMRNFVFQRAVGMGQDSGSLNTDKLYRAYWLPLDRSFWKIPEARGRLVRPRLEWMLVDHLTAQKADLVSAEQLYDEYRKWILNQTPFGSVEEELQSITATADVFRRVVTHDKADPLGRFGLFSRAFDVSTLMPLVIYLATEAELGNRLEAALLLLQSYVVRRDICGLTNKNYNRFFAEVVGKLRGLPGDRLQALRTLLESGKAELIKWPDNLTWSTAWLTRTQYKAGRQGRIKYMLEAIEAAKRTSADEVVEIKSDLTIEHIMPVGWRAYWTLPPSADGEIDPELDRLMRETQRDTALNTFGNLTLLTQPLNSTVSNAAFGNKKDAITDQSALALNREIIKYNDWDETIIVQRGIDLFGVAKTIWPEPTSVPVVPPNSAVAT